MESRLIAAKLALIGWAAFMAVQEDLPLAPAVFLLLLYFIANIAMYIWNRKAFPAFFAACSIGIAGFGALYVNPLFVIFAPLSVLELAERWPVPRSIQALILLVPVFYLKTGTAGQYVFSAAFSWIIWDTAITYADRLEKKEQQLDRLRTSVQRLARRLNENEEFIRQSEYTYRLEERNRISQEIHDNVGHAMTGALIQMEAAKSLLEKDPAQARALLQNAITITKEGIESIRLTLKQMKPPVEQVGIHRLQLALDAFSARYELETVLTYSGNLDCITHVQWKIIQENVKEALTNARKYADASQIAINIQILNKIIKAEVKDNGKGAAKIKKGIGITGMEERAASLGGHVITDGSHGFSVTTLLPIEP
ncbi:sensor histidine kinase [Weizmannia sp. FSL W8-0401]|uniref:sensor histidine kinase n=1 Tax=Weizmannia sp. FSL W8-0401 TaxID=2954554 RepID=UPI0030FC4463